MREAGLLLLPRSTVGPAQHLLLYYSYHELTSFVTRCHPALRPSQAAFCSNHKREGMVDVTTKRCQEPGCTKRAVCGQPGERPTFCVEHRKDDMVRITSNGSAGPPPGPSRASKGDESS